MPWSVSDYSSHPDLPRFATAPSHERQALGSFFRRRGALSMTCNLVGCVQPLPSEIDPCMGCCKTFATLFARC